MKLDEIQEMKEELFVLADILGEQGECISKALDYIKSLEQVQEDAYDNWA
jgi:hypothetical protein